MSVPASYYTVNQAAMLVVLCLGLAANSLSAFIWLARLKGKSAAFFLGCLSIADALFCLTQTVHTCLPLAGAERTCESGIAGLFVTLFANSSRLLTVAVVVQRVVAVSRPLSVARICTTGRQVIILAGLSVPPLAYSSFEVYAFRLYHVICEAGFDGQMPEYAQYVSLLRNSMVSYLAWHALLVVAILITNGVLLFITYTITEVNSESSTSSTSTRSWHRRLQRRLTVMVLCISVFSLLDASLLLARNVHASGYLDLGMDHEDLVDLDLGYHWIYVLNSSVNFLFYSCFGGDFRAELRELWARALMKLCGPCGYMGRTGGGGERRSSESSSRTRSTSASAKGEPV